MTPRHYNQFVAQRTVLPGESIGDTNHCANSVTEYPASPLSVEGLPLDGSDFFEYVNGSSVQLDGSRCAATFSGIRRLVNLSRYTVFLWDLAMHPSLCDGCAGK